LQGQRGDGLAALGLLDEFLERTGNPDPRRPEVPFRPPHREASPPQLADPSVVHEFRLRVVPPDGLTEAEVRRLLEHLAADFGKAVVAREVSLEGIRRTSGRPRPDEAMTFTRLKPPAGEAETGGVT
jgi:hypothetical protein